MIRVLGLALYGPKAASTRYRLLQYGAELMEHGINLESSYLLDDEYLIRSFEGRGVSLQNLIRSGLHRTNILFHQREYDCAIIHCELFPFFPGFLESRLLKIPYIYDFDDAFYLKYNSKKNSLSSFILGKKFEQVIHKAAAVTAGNNNLCAFASLHNPNVHHLPTVVDTTKYNNIREYKDESPFTIGWIGSPSTAPFLNLVTDAIQSIGKQGPVRLVVIGGRAPAIPNVEVIEQPWNENTEIADINTFDIGIMPLPDNDWSKGKCAFKLIQCMACGIPVVGSNIGANKEVVNSESGFLATSTEDWVKAISTLRDNPTLRRSMGDAARTRIESYYSLEKYQSKFLEIVKTVVKENKE